jgi:hypothetical protein
MTREGLAPMSEDRPCYTIANSVTGSRPRPSGRPSGIAENP